MYKKQGYLKEKFKLFHLCDQSEKNYSFHYHDFYKIVFFIKGNVTYNIEGKNYELSPYDIVFVGKNQLHRPVISGLCEYERYVIYLSDDLLKEDERLFLGFKEAFNKHENVLRLNASDNGKVIELLQGAYNRLKSDGFANDIYARLMVYEIILRLSETIAIKGFDYDGKVQYNAKISEACEYINNNLASDLSVDMLSEKFYTSKYYFMRQFKMQTGIPVHQYIIEKRIQYTNQLVNDGMKVTVACIEAGFNDYSTYLRASKRNKLRKEHE